MAFNLRGKQEAWRRTRVVLNEWLVESCIPKRNIKKDEVITYDDGKLPPNLLADKLRAEQYKHFRGETWLASSFQRPKLNSLSAFSLSLEF